MAPIARVLMCPPDHYGVFYVINPWMDVARQADQPAARSQWERLRGVLQAAGAEIQLMTPVAGLPDMVFTANAALVYEQRAVLSRFRHAERQAEVEHFRRSLTENGFDVTETPDGHAFEGAGDALFCGDTLFAGYRQRSDAVGHQKIAALLGVRVLAVELVNAYYYHLDTCFCPLDESTAIWFPPAFDEYGQRVIRGNIATLIEVAEPEARNFACNAAVVGRTVVTNTGCPDLHRQLGLAGFNPVETPLSEFVKAGGSAKCLTLRLDGEEAASWRTSASTSHAGLKRPPSSPAVLGDRRDRQPPAGTPPTARQA